MTVGAAGDRRVARRAPAVSRRGRVALLAALLAGAALAVASLCIGDPLLSPARAFELLRHPDDSVASIIVHTIRVPRAVLAIAVGAALAVAGVVMQALTRNPLAEPGLLGVNAGASTAVAVAYVVLGVHDFSATLLFAFAGACLAAILVALLGGVGRSASIARLVLAGVAVGAVLSGITQALSLIDPAEYARIRVWETGSLAARDTPTALLVSVLIVAGVALAVGIGPGLNLLVLGEDAAHTLGARVPRVRAIGLVLIVLLCGTATAAVGPIAFVGLLVPHTVRAVVGADQVRILAASVLVGPVLLLASDVIARTVVAPGELPLGVVTAFLGAPVLIALVHRRRRMT